MRQAPAHGRKSVLAIKKRVVIKDYLNRTLFAMQICQVASLVFFLDFTGSIQYQNLFTL